VDAALGRDRVRPARRVLEAEDLDREALGRERRGGARARQAGADDDHGLGGAVARADEPVCVEPGVPLLVQGTGGDLRVERHALPSLALHALASVVAGDTACCSAGSGSAPLTNATGTVAKPSVSTTASVVASARSCRLRCGRSSPSVWNMLQTACRRWRPSASTAST